MKKIFTYIALVFFVMNTATVNAQGAVVPLNPANAVQDQEDGGTSATGFRPTNGVGGGSGTQFSAELTFLETLLSSKYVVAISLVIAIIGFFQFIIHGNGFGIIMIVLAVALSSFPGMYKSFYSGVRPFVHSAAGTDQTQPWQ